MTKKGEEKFQKRRLRGSYLSVIISISLVLFTIGIFGLIVLFIHNQSNQIKESIGFNIYLHDDVKDIDVTRLQKAIEASDYAREVHYISKEDAVEVTKEIVGEDFMDYLDYNPLLACFEVKVNADYAHTDSIASIAANLAKSSKIKEISYQAPIIAAVQENLRQLGIVVLIVTLLLLIVSIALINNSIRLSIYSRRFIIKSMQLVGATQSFIRRPFVRRGVLHGVYSALIAILLTMAGIYYAQQYFPSFIQFNELEILASLFGGMLALGVIISWVSTSLAVRKFIRTRSSKLHG